MLRILTHQQLRFRNSIGQRLHVHEHESDKTCHWQGVFKPLGFFLFRQGDERLCGHIPQLSLTEEGWKSWLCKNDSSFNVMNMVVILQRICLILPLPFIENE